MTPPNWYNQAVIALVGEGLAVETHAGGGILAARQMATTLFTPLQPFAARIADKRCSSLRMTEA